MARRRKASGFTWLLVAGGAFTVGLALMRILKKPATVAATTPAGAPMTVSQS